MQTQLAWVSGTISSVHCSSYKMPGWTLPYSHFLASFRMHFLSLLLKGESEEAINSHTNSADESWILTTKCQSEPGAFLSRQRFNIPVQGVRGHWKVFNIGLSGWVEQRHLGLTTGDLGSSGLPLRRPLGDEQISFVQKRVWLGTRPQSFTLSCGFLVRWTFSPMGHIQPQLPKESGHYSERT